MIEIGEIIMRVPAGNATEGKMIGESVAGRIAEMLPDNLKDIQVGELNVKLNASPEATNEEMANDIARQVLAQLKHL